MPGLLLTDFLIIAKYKKPPRGWTEDMVISDVIEKLQEGGLDFQLEKMPEGSLNVMLRPKKENNN